MVWRLHLFLAMKRIAPFLLALPLLLAPSESSAADHYDMYESKDFAGTNLERHHDIVDLFTFPTAAKAGPGQKKKLVMIMNTHNRANAATVFDDTLLYSFRVMTGKTRGEGNEYRFTCTFDAGASATETASKRVQSASCVAFRIEKDPRSATGRRAVPVRGRKVKVDALSKTSSSPLRIFAGRRADGFFGDAAGLGEMLVTRSLPAAFSGPVVQYGPRNLTALTDDLAIALEVDFAELFGEEATVFRVAAETAVRKTHATGEEQ